VQDQRDARYNLLRGYFRGADDDTINERDEERLATVTLPLGTSPIGKPLGFLALHAVGVRVVSLRRSTGKTLAADEALVLEGGDTLVLSGHAEALAVAEEKILRGRALKNNPAAA
jgi:monovalent cation:H+ antiporter-2, CPA2 family